MLCKFACYKLPIKKPNASLGQIQCETVFFSQLYLSNCSSSVYYSDPPIVMRLYFYLQVELVKRKEKNLIIC